VQAMKRAVVAGVMSVVAAFAVVLASTPAHALVSKSGSESCSSIYKGVGVRSYGTGEIKHYTPSGTLRATFQNPEVPLARFSETTILSATWKVTSDGWLNNPGTYSYCALH
jgi:hypothetical protein